MFKLFNRRIYIARHWRFSFLLENAQPGKAVLRPEVAYKFARVEYIGVVRLCLSLSKPGSGFDKLNFSPALPSHSKLQ